MDEITVDVKSPALSITYAYAVDEDMSYSNQISKSGMDFRFKDRHRFALLAYGDFEILMHFIYGKPQDVINYVNYKRMARYVYTHKFIRVVGFKYVRDVLDYVARSTDVAPANLGFSNVNLFRVPEQSTSFDNYDFVDSHGRSFFVH